MAPRSPTSIVPTDKWLLNVGLRLDSFGFVGHEYDRRRRSAARRAARQFWFNAYNLDNCVINSDRSTGSEPESRGSLPGRFCTQQTCRTLRRNFTYNIYQPRIAGTYTSIRTTSSASPTAVTPKRRTRRSSSTTRARRTLADYIGSHFLQFGRNTPGYPILPPTSINYDISWEHRLKEHRLVVQADAILAADAGPNPAVLPDPA